MFIMLFVTSLAIAQNEETAKTSKTVKKAKQTVAKKTKPAATKVEAAAPAPETDNLADLKEETNKALTDLKGQIDKVKSDNSDARVGGVVFFQWSKYTQGGTASTPNAFDVTRAYLDFKKKLDWGASSRVTLDVARITGAARQNLFDYLKYAYVDIPVKVSALQFVPWELTAKLGLQHTIWIDWADKILNLRYIAKSIVDNEGIMSSADFGLGATGKVLISGLPEIEYHATVLNGSGYATNEGDSKKAVAARLNAGIYDDPIGGKVLLGTYLNLEGVGTSLDWAGTNKQGGVEVAYKHELGSANIEYITGSKSNKKIGATSIGGVFNIGSALNFLPNLSLFYRTDNYDPDTAASNNEKKKTFMGATYDYGKDVRLALDQQTSQTGNGATTSIMYLHSSIAF
jgi:hypothetical protein